VALFSSGVASGGRFLCAYLVAHDEFFLNLCREVYSSLLSTGKTEALGVENAAACVDSDFSATGGAPEKYGQ